MARAKRISFSTHLAIVYTLIIAIPLLILILLASEYLNSNLMQSINQEALKTVHDNTAYVINYIDQMERLEAVMSSDYELLRTFYFADPKDTEAIIESMLFHVKALERLQFALPQIYNIHLFAENPAIPERWPLVFRQERLPLQDFPRWSYNYRDPIMSNLAQSKEPAICLTSELLLNKRHVGYLQISMKMREFIPFAYYTETGEAMPLSTNYVFANKQLISPPDAISGTLQDLIQTENEQRGTLFTTIHHRPYTIAYQYIPRLDMYMVHARQLSAVTRSISLVRFAAFFIIFASIGLLFFVITFATRKLVARLYVVMDGLRQVKEGNLQTAITVPGNDEVAEMASLFSDMVAQLRTLFDEIKREHELVAQTEIKAMQNQINAHFLYNALETIKMQAELVNQRSLAESITILGRLMRYSLKLNKHQVPLEQELDYIRDYIAFMNIRNDYQIHLLVQVPDTFKTIEIPKMLIQPIVENAVKHGIEVLGEDASITISAYTETSAHRWWISVQDSGVGISESRRAELEERILTGIEADSPSGGIGLINIQQRLFAFYGRDYRLVVESTAGQGTRVAIPLPLPNEMITQGSV